MADLNCYIATFNCGRAPVNIDHFAANLFNCLKTNVPPELVVLSLQEIAPIGYGFLGGSLLTPYLSRFATAVNDAAVQQFESGNGEYGTVTVQNVGMTAIMVFARSSFKERIRWIERAGVGVGLWEMGNKGAVGVRLGLQETMVTFVAAHLAPMEDAWERRNEDWRCICEGLVFERAKASGGSKLTGNGGDEAEPLLSSPAEQGASSDERSLFSPISHVYVSGDLNYRTLDAAPGPDDHKGWPKPVESVSDVQQYSQVLEHDQLTRERKKNKTLDYLTESEITFPPTYKYSTAAQTQASITPAKQSADISLWAKHRAPSWCDRILYLASAPPQVHSYTALPVQPTSDHRPVVLSFSLPLKPLDGAATDIKPPCAVRKDWREARAAARRYEYMVGIAAYLALTWEGEALLGGTVVGIVGGYLALRALIGC